MLTALFFVSGLSAMEKSLGLMALLLVGGALAVGIHEARKSERGVLGWIVSIVAAIVGGTIGGMVLSFGAMIPADAIGKRLGPGWAELDATVGLIAMLIGIVLGARLALRLANRFR